MEGKKRKRKELSLKTSKKQAVWKTEATGGQVQTVQEPANSKFQTKDIFRASEAVDLETIGVCKNAEQKGKRTAPFVKNIATNENLRMQLKALLPTSQRWQDLEDLPELVFSPEENDPSESQEIGEQVRSNKSEFDVAYTDLPKPDILYLTSTKPILLDVEHILKECVHDNSCSMDSGQTEESAISTGYNIGDKAIQLESVQAEKSKQEEASHQSNLSKKCDVVDLTKIDSANSPVSGRIASVAKDFQSCSSFACRNSGRSAVSSKTSFSGPSSKGPLEIRAESSTALPRFERGESSLQFRNSKSLSCGQEKVQMPVLCAETIGNASQNISREEEQLKCCPMCQCKFSLGTSQRYIDQHISDCIESGTIMDDDDENEWCGPSFPYDTK